MKSLDVGGLIAPCVRKQADGKNVLGFDWVLMGLVEPGTAIRNIQLLYFRGEGMHLPEAIGLDVWVLTQRMLNSMNVFRYQDGSHFLLRLPML